MFHPLTYPSRPLATEAVAGHGTQAIGFGFSTITKREVQFAKFGMTKAATGKDTHCLST
jgi:hypothetical protein